MIAKETLGKLRPGVKVRVTETIKEGGKERASNFEGMIICRKHGSEPGATYTVRNVVGGVGVEKTIPLYSPRIAKIKILQEPKRVRRAKLYYTREVSEKKLRRKIK